MFLAELPLYKKLSGKRSRVLAEAVLPLLPEHGSILDFGCGNMFTAKHLIDLNPNLKITGMDVIEDQNLDKKILDHPALSFKQINSREIPFPDHTFDTTMVISTLHHTPEPEYYIQELKRVTKPGGNLIVVEEMYLNTVDKIWTSGQDWVLNKMKKGVPVPLNFRPYRHYLQVFKDQNLTIRKETFIRMPITLMHHYIFQLQVPQV